MIETFHNPYGSFGISNNPSTTIIAYPDKSEGYVRVKAYDSMMNTPLINAHDYQITILTINTECTMLATASEYGTLIRIFHIGDGALILELRRGSEKSEIHNLIFSEPLKFIACSSDRKTVHIFSLSTALKILREKSNEKKEEGYVNLHNNNNNHGNTVSNEEEEEEPKNQKSFLGKIIKYLKIPKGYWNSEWSFAQFRVDDPNSVCCFGPDNKICVVTSSGVFSHASYDPRNGGECLKVQEYKIKLDEN